MSRVTADVKVDLARSKVQQWGAAMAGGVWDWHALGHALQLAHEAIDALPTYQRPWNILADVYHRIGKSDLAAQCLRRAYVLATPGPNHPGRFYRSVEQNLRSGYPFNAAGGARRQQPPPWFESKYQRYWVIDQQLLALPPSVGTAPADVPTAFISYAREDGDAAERLRTDLGKCGIAAWKDTHDLLPGEPWEEVIAENLRIKDFALICLSRVSVSKAGYFQVELDTALQLQTQRPSSAVYLIPVRLDACDIPNELQRFHCADLYQDWPATVAQICATIGKYHKAPMSPRSWPTIPKWQQYAIIGFVAGLLSVIVALWLLR